MIEKFDLLRLEQEKKILSLDKVVITDCRFDNEIQLIRKFGGKIIHIYRNQLPDWFDDFKNGKSEPPKNLHPSEWSWIKNDFDVEINNNSTIDYLEKKIYLFS